MHASKNDVGDALWDGSRVSNRKLEQNQVLQKKLSELAGSWRAEDEIFTRSKPSPPKSKMLLTHVNYSSSPALLGPSPTRTASGTLLSSLAQQNSGELQRSADVSLSRPDLLGNPSKSASRAQRIGSANVDSSSYLSDVRCHPNPQKSDQQLAQLRSLPPLVDDTKRVEAKDQADDVVLHKQLTMAIARIDELEEKTASALARATVAEVALEQKTAAETSSRQLRAENAELRQNAETICTQLQSENAELRKVVECLLEQKKTAEISLGQLRAENAEVRQLATRQAEGIEALERQLATRQKAIAEATEGAEQAQDECAQLREVNDSLRLTAKNIQIQLEAKPQRTCGSSPSEENEQLRESLKKLETQVDEASRESCHTAEEHRRELDDQNNALRRAVEGLREIPRLRDENEALRSTVSQMKVQLDSMMLDWAGGDAESDADEVLSAGDQHG